MKVTTSLHYSTSVHTITSTCAMPQAAAGIIMMMMMILQYKITFSQGTSSLNSPTNYVLRSTDASHTRLIFHKTSTEPRPHHSQHSQQQKHCDEMKQKHSASLPRVTYSGTIHYRQPQSSHPQVILSVLQYRTDYTRHPPCSTCTVYFGSSPALTGMRYSPLRYVTGCQRDND